MGNHKKNCIEAFWMISSARQPMHPNEIGDHDVIECAMQAFKVSTNVSPILFAWQLPGHSV